MTVASPHNHRASSASPFLGQTVVFTGRLASVGRREAHALVERLGGLAADEVTTRTTMLVIGAAVPTRATQRSSIERLSEPLPHEEKTNKLKRAEAVNAKTPGQIQVVSEDHFCRLGQLPSIAALQGRYHTHRRMRELYPLVHDGRLRHLEKWGLIRPVARNNADTYYSFPDVALVKQVSDELEQDHSFRGAVRRRLAARDGQQALNFGAVRRDARPAKVVALGRREATKIRTAPSTGWSETDGQSVLAARFFLEGSELDEGGEADREKARMAYRKALLLDPTLVPAIVNLANLHYANDDLVEAQALYCRALTLEPECFEAHFNLGNIHHDLGRYQEAVAYYHEALGLNPSYADAHFYLAVTLEKMERSQEAKAHWRMYQQLAPEGDWVDLAREFSE